MTSFVLITVPHYSDQLDWPAILVQWATDSNLTRHSFERIAYLAPMIWSGFLFGRKGGITASLVALACMLPRVFLISARPADALLETGAVFVVGSLASLSFDSFRRERERRLQLAALNETSAILSQSLELRRVLDRALENVIDIVRVDAALIFLLDKDSGELELTAHSGVSDETARGVSKYRPGEGFPKIKVQEEGIQSQLVVLLKSTGKIVGTLCVAKRSKHEFQREEVELLTAIGNQIGVAVENARLYENERQIGEQLRASEERYRQLFENAYDAIWFHDSEGRIIAANESFSRLTGYGLGESESIKESDLITGDSADRVIELENQVLKGKALSPIAEVTLIRKDKSEASVQLSTSPLMSQGEFAAFQHMARDVTEEKRLKENLRFYIHQVTKAQEDERKRIARELHDDTIQALVVISRQLDDFGSHQKGLSKDNRLFFEDLRQHANSVMEGVRRLSQDLRPPTLDRLGLRPALEWLADHITNQSGVAVAMKVQGVERRLPSEVELVLFRVAQEALTNVWRHSEATTAEVEAEFKKTETRITVRDNGKGFSPPNATGDLVKEGRLGLAGMQERASLLGGALVIQSEAGKGTTVTVTVPA